MASNMENFELLFSNEFNHMTEKDDLLSITHRLASNMNNKYFFNPEPFKIHKSVNIYENFEDRNLRQSYYQDCTFKEANLARTGLAGSIFINCLFKPCNFIDSNLQSCDFRNCDFEKITFEYTRMNKSSFYKTTFIDCTFKSVSINDAIFDDCKFINCKWTVSIENTVFKDTLFNNVKFRSMNFEFATFENIKAINVKFPFPTIPFIYNGLKYVLTTNDNIRITSAQKPEGLTKEEYSQYINDLEQFYVATQNYFPLTNIYIAQEKYDKVLEAIISGIKIAIQLRAFRMLKYYCKQIKYINNITAHQRQDLYFFILNEISLSELENFEKNSLNLYLPEVKNLLFTETQNEIIQILIDTNINESEFDKLTILMSVIDKFLENKCTYSIELRHNSPFQGLIDILSNPENVQTIIAGFNLIVALTFGCIGVVQNRHKKLSKEDEEKCKQYGNELSSNGIIINNVYIVNNGNIFISNQNSSQGDIYLNK